MSAFADAPTCTPPGLASSVIAGVSTVKKPLVWVEDAVGPPAKSACRLSSYASTACSDTLSRDPSDGLPAVAPPKTAGYGLATFCASARAPATHRTSTDAAVQL